MNKSQQGKYFSYHDKSEEKLIELEPKSIGIDAKIRGIPLPDDLPTPTHKDQGVINADATFAAAVKEGLAALAGKRGMAYNCLLYDAAIVQRKHYTNLVDATNAVSEVLKSGAVIERLKAAGTKL